MGEAGRNMLILLGIFIAALICQASTAALQKSFTDPLTLHYRTIVVDTHNDTMMRVVDSNTGLPKVDIGKPTSFHVDVAKMKKGGLKVPFFAAYTSASGNPDGSADYAAANSRLLASMNGLHWTVGQNQDTMGLVRDYDDVFLLQRHGKIAAVLSIEGAYSLQEANGLELLRQYYDLGVRAVGLTHNLSNDLGEGVEGAYVDGRQSSGGLTKLGKEVVREMNRLGMIIDVSHMNESTFWDVLKISEAPVMASHSGSFSQRKHVRNLTDEQIIALASRGGVIQVICWGTVVVYGGDRTVARMVDHIDRIVALAGVDHVGVGTDFDGANMLDDLQDASMLPRITEELAKRGYSSRNIEKILGGNALRVMETVWKGAQRRGLLSTDIVPDWGMGDVFDSPLTGVHAHVAEGVDLQEDGLSAIVDGMVFRLDYRKENREIHLAFGRELSRGFHVITFQGTDKTGKVVRTTQTIYVRNNME